MTFQKIWRCAGDFFKVLLKFKIAATDQLQLFVGAKTYKISQKLFTFPAIWRCAGDFFKVLLKFKIAATDQLQFFCGRKKRKNIKSEIIQILNFTSPTIWRCAGDFFKVSLKFKMTAMDELHSFFWGGGAQNNSHFTITSPTIW